MCTKKVIKVYSSTTTKVDKVFLCYGHKAYKKFSEKRYKSEDSKITKGGVAVLYDRHNGSYEVCIGVKKWEDVIQLNGLIVHELSHAVDYIMRENDLTDTEYRAYTMQSMYQTAMCFIDEILFTSGSKNKKDVDEIRI